MQSNKLSSLIDDFETQDSVAPKVDNKLSSLIDNFESDKVSQLKSNISASTSITPEQATKQYQIYQQTKIPVDVVRTQENQIKQMTELNSINYQDILNKYPLTAKQLSDPNKVAAIRDDVDSLSYFERVFGSVKQEYKAAQENVAQADLLVKQMNYDVTGNKKFKLSPLEENSLALIEESQAQNKDYKLGFVSSIPSYTAAAIPTILSTIPETLAGAAVGAAAGGAITKTPVGAIAGATLGSRAGAAYGAGKLEMGLAYKDLKNLVDETGKPIEKEVAAGAAIATGAVNGLIELIPFEAATGQIKKAFSREGVKTAAKTKVGREYLKNIGQLAAAEGLAEGSQELMNVLFTEAAKVASTGDFSIVGMKDANDTEGLYKFLSETGIRIAESAKAGAGGGIGLGIATGGVTAAKQIYDQRNQGKQESEEISKTVEKIKESKIFKRDPELFKETTQDTLGEQNVYIPAEQVQTFFQTKTPEEIEQFYQAVPEARAQLSEALESGGNLVLPANQILTAIAQNQNFAELQKHMSFTPESLSEQAAQDTFLSNVSDTVNFEQKNQKEAVGQEAVKNNIKNQILGLNLPKNEAQNIIAALTSYYDTKSSRYGSQEAKKVLDSYLGNLEVKNAVFNRLQPMVKNTKVDELDKFINQARKFNPKKPTKPLLKFLKEKGGVRMDSNLAGELNALGITTKTAPGLFRKESDLGDVDNFPANEFIEKFPNSGVEIEGDYISRQAILDLIGRELQGVDISKEISPEEERMFQFLEDLDRLGVDIKNSDNETIKKAIENYKQEQGYFQIQTKDRAEELNKKAIELTGVTANPLEAGYILSNGKMLDMTGRHQAAGYVKAGEKFIAEKDDYLKGERAVDHREIAQELVDASGTDAMFKFMSESGAIRVDFNSGIIDSVIPPSNTQLSQIVRAAKIAGLDSLEIEHTDDKGNRISGATISNITASNIKKVFLNDIFYQGGLGIIQKDQELALKSLDKFLKENGIEPKTIEEKQEAYESLRPSEKLELITRTINEAKNNLDDYFNSKTFFQSGFGIIAADQERANAILDKFLKEELGIEPKTEAERIKGFANLRPSEQLNVIKKQQKDIGESLVDYLGKKLFFQSGDIIQGQTQFIGQKPIISLFKSKNRSTLLHELGHVFLQIESEVAKLPDISDQVKKDWKTIEEWLDIKDGKITTEQHEKFARGFEAYLREGRAPSIGLRNAFRKFKSWLLRIYKNVKALDVEISEPIRKVFDRMLATDEEIENLKSNPLFRADQAILDSLSEEEQKKYLALTQNAKESAKEKLLSRSLKELSKQNTKSFKEEKAKVRAELEKQLNETPVYRALNILKSPDYKLNRGSVENYDGDFIKRLPKNIIAEDGVDVDMAADFLGFKDGGEMLNSLAEAPSFKTELKNAVDEEMAARYVEPINEEEAISASENDARAKKILYELNNANKKVNTFIDTTENYKQKAKDILAKKEIKDATQSNIYYLNEVKAAREAGIAYGKKDYTKAVEWKKKQLLNHYLYRESQQIKKDVKDFLKRAERYKRKPVVGKVSIDEDYRQRIVGLLQDFGIDAKDFDYEKTNIAELENWKKEQTEEGVLGLVNFSEIGEFQDKDNIRTLTTDQFKTLDNAVTNLAHIGQGLRSLEIEGKRVELAEIAKEIKQTIEDNLKERPEIRGNLTPKQKLNAAFESFMMPLIKVKNIALKLDGEKPLGTFYNYFVKPIATGELKRNDMMEEAYHKLDSLYRKYFGKKAGEISGKKVFIPEANFSYSKQDMIAFALNWGNGTNRRRIKDGFNYGDAQVNAILSNLTKKDWEFVQEMWDLIGSYYEPVAKLQRKLVGFKPGKVKPIPFKIKTSDGETVNLKGGYYPIAYNGQSTKNTTDDSLNAIFGSISDYIQWEKSYTKGRSDKKVTEQIDLTLKPAFRHLSTVLNDLALKEQAWNSYKILNNRIVKKAINSHAGEETTKQLDTWLKDIYGGSSLAYDAYNGLINSLRAGATISTMGFKIATALMQPSGFVQSIVKIGWGNMLSGLFKTLGNGNPMEINKNVHFALEKSKILKDRSKTYQRDIFDTLKKMERKGSIAEKATAIYFWPMAKMQMLVDIPTWIGAYYKGLKDFNGDDSKAVDYADLVIAQAQGSGLEQDLSAFERGSAFGARKFNLVKIFTSFYTYFNAKLNLATESYRKTDFSKPRDVARFASDFILLFWIEALIGELLTGRAPDFGDDDEDNKFLAYNVGLMVSSFAGQFPIAREAAAAAKGFNDTPAGFSGVGKIGKGLYTVGKEFTKEDEVDISKVIEGLNEAGGIVFKYPSSQIDVFIDAQQKEKEGKEPAPIDYLLRPKK
jgi:hypothetical protein